METITAYFKNEYTEMWIKDGILHSRFYENLKVTLDIAKICVAERLNLCKGVSYPILFYGANLSQVDREAANFLQSGDGIKGLTAGAFLVKSNFEYTIFSFMVMFFKPTTPTKLFRDEQKAVEWLTQFRTKES